MFLFKKNKIKIVKYFWAGETIKVNITKHFFLKYRIHFFAFPCGSILLFLIFRNDLLNDIKSETEVFADDFKLLAGSLIKETTQS